MAKRWVNYFISALCFLLIKNDCGFDVYLQISPIKLNLTKFKYYAIQSIFILFIFAALT
jgi:hypothetical protein